MATGVMTETEFLEWSIAKRADTLHVALRLRELMKTSMVEDGPTAGALRSLVGVSFALWRAVFLAHRTGKAELRNKDATSFIEKMVTTNAITFSDDHKLREWTFGYYIDDALYRLERLSKTHPEIGFRDTDLKRRGTTTAQWDDFQRLFEKAVRYFETKTKDGASSPIGLTTAQAAG
jgi:hypothetical protein